MNILYKPLLRLLGTGAFLFVSGCQSVEEETIVPDIQEPEAQQQAEVIQQDPQLEEWEVDFRRQRLIGDLLYDALRALQQDRLLSPVDDNAHGRYRRVLAIDPENKFASEGIHNIVMRYLELANAASRQGRFSDAESYLERARFVDDEHAAIAGAEAILEAEINSGDLVFAMDPGRVAGKSVEVIDELASIAGQAQTNEAFVLITAPNDEIARWMYAVMRDSVNGYRLRGNIELGGHAIIRLRMPAKSSNSSSEKTQSGDS